jgi:competence protein ComEC
LEKLSKNMPFWDRTLDLIVLTHPDHDHIFGLLEVLKSYEVENILWTGVFKKSAEHKEWVDLIEKEGSNIIISQKDLKIFSKNTEMEVVYPLEVLENEEVRNFNDSSIVLKLDFKESTFLFTGDITSSAERVLKDIDTDLLKVAHHGSKESTSEEFLKETSPIIAVISSGENNSYGHPHKEVLERLKGVEVLRTDKKGDIEIINNGRTFFFD